MARCLDRLALKEPLEKWSDETIEAVVNAFTDEKFPTVIALNKIDHPDADKVSLPPPEELDVVMGFTGRRSLNRCRTLPKLQNRKIRHSWF